MSHAYAVQQSLQDFAGVFFCDCCGQNCLILLQLVSEFLFVYLFCRKLPKLANLPTCEDTYVTTFCDSSTLNTCELKT